MAAIDSAYQYYLSTYGNLRPSRYDTHKKSQLRDVYNRIVKSNKESPLYKIQNTEGIKEYAIDIKEASRNIQNTIASLSEAGGGIENVFSKKIAQSSDESVVTAEYIGKNSDGSEPSGFEIQVLQLAAAQTNLGNYLSPDRHDFTPGTYSFDLSTNTNSYEFQFTITPEDTNSSIQHKLAKLINHAGIGLTASLEGNDLGQYALKISSKQTGISDTEESLFQIFPAADTGSMHTMDTLGIHHIDTRAQNSSFILNGTEYSSYSNTFTVNDNFDITLHDINAEGESTQIGFKANSDAIADNIEQLIDAYNSMIKIGYLHDGESGSSRLIRDVSSVAKDHYNELESIGLNLDAKRYIHIDRNLLTDAVTAADAETAFSVLNSFKDSLHDKTTEAAINPMRYVNKVIVTYKNPGHNFAAPYISSFYSGMMLDTFC